MTSNSVTSLTDYVNNEVYKELPKLNTIYTNSDARLFIDLRREQGYTRELEKIVWKNSNLPQNVTLKAAAQIKMRLRIIRYYQGKYLYTLSNQGILMSFKEYSIAEQSDIALAA